MSYCSVIMNPFYYDRTNQEWSLIKAVSAKTQGVYSPCPKDLAIRTGKDILKQGKEDRKNLLPTTACSHDLGRSQEEAEIGWAQDKCGAGEMKTAEGAETGCIYSQQSLSRTFCSFFPALPIPSSLSRVRRSAPNYSCRGTLLWVQQA